MKQFIQNAVSNAFSSQEKRIRKTLLTDTFLALNESVPKQGPELLSGEELVSSLKYRTEEWEVFKRRTRDRKLVFLGLRPLAKDNACAPGRIATRADSITVSSSGRSEDRIYLFQENAFLRSYALNLAARFDSRFTETQFCIRWVDFHNRYRFRIQDETLHFDVVSRGQFYNGLYTCPFEVELGKTYKISIIVKDNSCFFICDGEILMNVAFETELFLSGGIAIIFWDTGGESNISASLSGIQLASVE